MTEQSQRDYRMDGLAVLFLLLAGFLAACLWSHDPADPPTELVYPANASVRNYCGPAGSATARWLVDVLGVASWGSILLTISLADAVFRRSGRREIAWIVSGYAIALPAFAAIVDRATSAGAWTGLAGPGGLTGYLVAAVFEEYFSRIGSLLILLPLLAVGVLLVGDGRLLAVLAWFGRSIPRWIRGLVHRLASFWDDDPMLASPTPIEAAPAELLDDDPDESHLPIVRTGFDVDEPAPAAAEVSFERPPAPLTAFRLPDLDMLDDPEPFEFGDHDQEIRERARVLEKTLAEFQMKVKVVQIDTGPVVTQYELELEPGLRARKVMASAEDLAIALRAPSVRIVAPIPGKNTVGVEVPNERRAKVGLKEVMQKSMAVAAKMRLPLYLGKDVKGQPLVFDLANMPHLLIAGRTGTGKSVCLNALILSILMTRAPDQVKLLMIDPKMVELSLYKDIPHLLHPVVTEMKKAEALLAWAVDKMEERYDLLARVGVRHIDAFNKLSREEVMEKLGPMPEEDAARIPTQMPYILIFADEMADLIMTSAKEVEGHIIRLAQKSRAVGIHLILATQKPTVDVITGLIKSNLPARIAFQVASRTDSRVVLDEMGADKLLGNGDMLFLYPGTSKILRAQGTYISDREIQAITEFLCAQAQPQYSTEVVQAAAGIGRTAGGTGNLADRDDLYEQAIEVIVHEQRGSVSLLQRALGVGYGRGARLIDYMAEDGVVGGYNGSQAREVLISPEDWPEFRRTHFGKAG